MITSRPPTAVTTFFSFTPAVSNSERIVLATRVGSITSPSTIASGTRGVAAALTTRGRPFP